MASRFTCPHCETAHSAWQGAARGLERASRCGGCGRKLCFTFRRHEHDYLDLSCSIFYLGAVIMVAAGADVARQGPELVVFILCLAIAQIITRFQLVTLFAKLIDFEQRPNHRIGVSRTRL